MVMWLMFLRSRSQPSPIPLDLITALVVEPLLKLLMANRCSASDSHDKQLAEDIEVEGASDAGPEVSIWGCLETVVEQWY